MTPRRRLRVVLSAFAVAAAALVSAFAPASSARAQDATADDAPAAAAEPGPWEEVVFLPESGLSVLLERDPRGVLLDRATYIDLHRRARAARGESSAAAAGGGAVRLLRCDVEGTVAGEQARLTVRLSIHVRGPDRVSLPVRLGGSVTSATLDGRPATVGADAKGVFALAVRGEGLHDAVVEVVAPVARSKGVRSVSVALPAAPASRWTLEIPGRVTASAGEGLWRSERLTGPDRTRLVAFGAQNALVATWHEGDQGTDLPPLVRARVRTLAEVGERSLDAVILLRIDCLRSPLDAFAVTLPADLAVVGVDGDGASLVPAAPQTAPPVAGRAPYTLRFAERFTGVRTVVIRTTRPLPGAGTIDLPVVDLPGATTVERILAVRFKDGLRGFVEAGAGAERLDPALSEDGAVDALLRLAADAAPRATSERPAVLLRADVRVVLDLADDGPWLAASFLYLPRGDRLYGVDPLLPPGFLPESVAVSGDRAFLRGTTPDGRLSLVFPGGVEAGSAVTVTVRGRWPVAGWTAEDAVERTAPLPRIDAGTGVEADGWLGVAVPPGTEAREEETTGLVPVAVAELRERAGFTAEGLTLGWRFRGGSPGGRLRVTRPAAAVTANVALLAVPAEDHLTIEGSIAVSVQRSGVREVRVRVVPSLGDLLRIEGPDVAERRRVTADGRDTWTVRFGRQVRDGTRLVLRAELPLTAGVAAVPAISVEGAAREELLVGVAAGGELEVTTESTGLREADPADLAPVVGARAAGLLRAWRGVRDATPTLTVRTVRLPASPLPAAFADSVSLRTVIGMDGIARTRLDARVRNADRQALEVTLPAGARLSSARVAGNAVKPVQTAAGVLLVPIVPSAEPFDVVLVYEEALPGDPGSASLHAPDLGVPGSRAVWTVTLPEGSIPLDASGEFASAPVRAGTPLCLRIAGGLTSAVTVVTMKAADSAAPRAARPGAAGAPMPAPAMPAHEEAPPESREPAGDPTGAPGDLPVLGERVPEIAPQTRIEARAAQRGLFGMDIRLLAAGPAITATRLGPTGGIDVTWRTATGRLTFAFLAAILAFAAALIARRAGIGAPTWTVLALGLFTAGPIVLDLADTAAWDGACIATFLYAALAFLRRVYGGVAGWVGRRLPRRTRSTFAAVAVVALAFASGVTRADEPARKAPPPLPASPDRVYVPYDPKRPETLRVPERVFLPYARYLALWNAANPADRIESAAPPVVVAAAYDGRVEVSESNRAVVITARYEIDPVDGGVVALPPGAAVDGVTLDGRAVPVTAGATVPGGSTLVAVPRGTAAGTRIVLVATLRWPVAGDPPGGSLRTPIPRVPRSSLVLVVPVADAVVAVTSAGGWSATPAEGGTRITADLGPVDVLDVAWQPRGADAAGGRTRFEADTEVVALLRAGLVEWTADVTLRVLTGIVQEFDSALPAGLEIQSVTGPAVASWTIVDGLAPGSGVPGDRRLRVRLIGAGPGETRISIAGLVRLARADEAVVVPDLTVSGASADRARVVVAADDGRLVVVERDGYERTDLAAGPSAGARPGAVAFRRVRSPSRLTVRVEPFAAGVSVTSRQHLHIGSDASRLRAEFDLVPGPRGLHEADVALPAGWTLDEAVGANSFPGNGRVRLVFTGSPHAARTLTLRLRGPVVSEGAPAAAEPSPFPILRVVGATRESADLLVSTTPEFAVTASGATGLESVPVDRFAGWAPLDPAERRALAWHDARGGGAVALRRESLVATVVPTVVADLTVLDDRVIVDALVRFDVRGGVERVFRVDVPPGIDDAWVLGEGLREVRREKIAGRERLTVTLQAPTSGAVMFRVLYDVLVPASGAVEVTGPEPVGGERTRAFLMIRALGESEVQIGAAPGLETCDVSDVPFVPQGLDPLRVLRFVRARDAAWRLPLRLVAHGFGELPEARIHLVDATTVADRDGSSRTRVLVRIFNRARSFLPVELPAGCDLESVLVAGVPVRPVTRPGEPGRVQVPVRVQSLGEESQVVSLTFRSGAVAPGGRFGTLDPRLPVFPGVPVDATTWRLLLPEDRDYSFSGNMDAVEEMEVAIARAEAYASDVSRLRSVISKGNRQQQAVALSNLESNTRELQESLDLARSRMDELEQAAAEGRVDKERLAGGRRKANELAQEIEKALGDVRRNTVDVQAAGTYRGPAGEVPPAATATYEAAEERTRFATRAGQAFKKWESNVVPGGSEAAKQTEAPAQTIFDIEIAQAAGIGQVDANKALAAHSAFDDLRALRRDVLLVDPAKPGESGGPATPDGGGGPTTGGGGDGARDRETQSGARSRAVWGTDTTIVPPAPGFDDAFFGTAVGTAGRAFGGADAGAGYAGFGGGGGGGGARATRPAAPPVQGLVSLAPPLVEQGRAYAFRKLDASATLTVSTRAPGIGRRVIAAASFLALFALVWGFRRRRARRG